MLTPPAAPALGPLPAPRKGLRDHFFSFGLAMFGLAVVIAGGAALLGLRGPSVYVVPLPSPAAPIPSAHPGTSIGSVRASSTASAAAPRDPPLPKPVRAPIPAG
jgi:hypothetical protein